MMNEPKQGIVKISPMSLSANDFFYFWASDIFYIFCVICGGMLIPMTVFLVLSFPTIYIQVAHLVYNSTCLLNAYFVYMRHRRKSVSLTYKSHPYVFYNTITWRAFCCCCYLQNSMNKCSANSLWMIENKSIWLFSNKCYHICAFSFRRNWPWHLFQKGAQAFPKLCIPGFALNACVLSCFSPVWIFDNSMTREFYRLSYGFSRQELWVYSSSHPHRAQGSNPDLL